jgi:hypothetical protein
MHGSTLVIQICEARELPGTPAAFAEVTFGKDKQMTPVSKPSNNPVWNQKYSFDVETGQESLTIQLRTNDMINNRLGSCSVPLAQLQGPEFSLDGWLELRNDGPRPVGHLKVSLQWIKSRVAFFDGLIARIDLQLAENQKVATDSAKMLQILYGTPFSELPEPFGFLRIPSQSPQPEQPSPVRKMAHKAEVAITTRALEIEKAIQAKVDTLVPRLALTLHLSQFRWADLTTWGSLIYITTSCLVLFSRPDFFNVVLNRTL